MLNKLIDNTKNKQLLILSTVFFIMLMLLGSSVSWHIGDNRIPSDDAANMTQTALEIYSSFENKDISAGLKDLYLHRGWRPIFLPSALVPFLIISLGNLEVSIFLFLFVFYVLLCVYTYLCLRNYLSMFLSCICTGFICSIPWVISFSHIFYAELPMLAVMVAALYHAQKLQDWKSLRHSIMLGIMLAFSIAFRPLVPMSAVFLLLVSVVAIGFKNKKISYSDLISAICVFVLALLLFVFRFFFILRSIWLTDLFLVIVLVIYMFAVHKIYLKFLRSYTFNTNFAVCIAVFLFGIGIWYLPFVKETWDWAYLASFGDMSQLYQGVGELNAFQAMITNLKQLGGVRLIILIIAAVNTIWMLIKSRARKMPGLWLIGMGLIQMIPVITMAALMPGSDLRRSFIAFYFLFLGLCVLGISPGIKWEKIRTAFIGLFTFVQLCSLSLAGIFFVNVPRIKSLPVITSYNVPNTKPNTDWLVFSEITKSVYLEPLVAAFTLAINSYNDRIFCPASLNVVALTKKSNIRFGYPWNFNELETGYRQLKDWQYTQIILDTRTNFPNIPEHKQNEPYSRLTRDLIERYNTNNLISVGWQVNREFSIDGTKLVLLASVYPGDVFLSPYENEAFSGNNSLAWATNENTGYEMSNINDGSGKPWGSKEGADDVYACVILSNPIKASFLRIQLFNPGGRSHLRDFSVVVTNSKPNEVTNPEWVILKSRIGSKGSFTEKNTVSPDNDDYCVITVEIDPSEINDKEYIVYGIACLRGTRGDKGNYAGGTGVYIRELQIAE